MTLLFYQHCLRKPFTILAQEVCTDFYFYYKTRHFTRSNNKYASNIIENIRQIPSTLPGPKTYVEILHKYQKTKVGTKNQIDELALHRKLVEIQI